MLKLVEEVDKKVVKFLLSCSFYKKGGYAHLFLLPLWTNKNYLTIKLLIYVRRTT